MIEPLQKETYENYPVVYDKDGLMLYHPYYHPNHRQPFTIVDYEYLCKYYEIDGVELISFALGRTPRSIIRAVNLLKDKELYEFYKNLNKFWL